MVSKQTHAHLALLHSGHLVTGRALVQLHHLEGVEAAILVAVC